MSNPQHITYECTLQTFHPVLSYPVRWLEWEQDYSMVLSSRLHRDEGREDKN